MDYSTILLVGLLNNFCDGVLFWFWWLLVAMVLLLSRLIDYSLDFGYVLVVLIYLCCLVDWFLIGLWVCFGCYDLFVWCYGGWLLWNVVCMFAVVEDGKMGKGHSNLYIYIIHIIPYDLNYDPTIESLNHCTFFVQLVFLLFCCRCYSNCRLSALRSVRFG